VPRGSVADALFWDTGDPYQYARLQPGDGEDILIVGGEDHKSGQAEDMPRRFAALERWTRLHFPTFRDVTWRWSGQVMETVDYLGYLGKNPGKAENVFVITGDSGMGMTHGTIGAMIVSNAILGLPSQWAKVFDPGRISVKSAGAYVHENLNVAAQMTDHFTSGDVTSAGDIPRGDGAIVRRGLHKLAIYRRDDGTIVERSAICPHAGCVVAWNNLEKCWDCPCHGSHFSAEGTVLNGPAVSDLGLAPGNDEPRIDHSHSPT
jgi:Rieske Fe-S protein